MEKQPRGGLLEKYKTCNKLSMAGGLGVAFVGALFAPALVVPGLLWASVDAGQLYVIDKWQNRKKNRAPQAMLTEGKIANIKS